MDAGDVRKIDAWAEDLAGIFAMSDLKVLFGERTEAALYKKLVAFVKEGVLIKVKRGLYAVPGTSLKIISSRINRDAYLSTGTVLARNLMIGAVPARRVQAVKVGRPRVYTCEFGVIEHLSIDPKLYFGFTLADGVKQATPEKAFLDVCYFAFKGKRFSFDPNGDVDTEALDEQVLSTYLKKYDSRFVSYFERIWIR